MTRGSAGTGEPDRLPDVATTSPRSAAALPAGLSAVHPTADDHVRVLEGLETWWGGFGGTAGAQQRALLVPRLFFQHFTDTSWLVEDRSHRLVAFLVGFLSQSQPGTAYIHFVGVDPAFRGKQLGRWLYEHFAGAVSQRGATTLRCITSPGNRASVAFRTRLGFEVEPGATELDGVAIQPDYDGPGLDRVCFVRHLPA
ncbi:GNAT family N-acetyltransferase [Modestobacter sp. SYSU DS0290]